MTETDRTAPKPQAPKAPKHPTTRTHHGRVFVDDYEWLRDKEAAETIAYLEAENAYTDEVTKDQQQLQEDIFQEIKSRVKETDMSCRPATVITGITAVPRRGRVISFRVGFRCCRTRIRGPRR